MTKAEFIARQQIAKRSQNISAIIALVMMLAALFCSVAMIDWSKRHHFTGWNPMLFTYAFFMVICVIVISCSVVRSIRQARKHGMRCAKCGTFFHGFTGQIAVASGHCGICGTGAYEC